MKGIKLMWKFLAILIVFTLLAMALPLGLSKVKASPGPIYVPDNYSTIQEAVNAASPGDTIIVRDGTYTENVDVNKDHLTVKSENGAEVTIVQAANPDDHVFEVRADYVSISGFTIKDATGNYKAGILLSNVEHCKVSNNIAVRNHLGIYLCNCSNSTLVNNTPWGNSQGILVFRSSNNTLNGNVAFNNRYGITLERSSANTLTSNLMSDNRYNFGVISGPPDYELSDFIQNIDTSNNVDGKPIYYWVNKQGVEIPTDAGYAGIVNCKNITAKDLTLSNNREGILLAYTNNSRIENVNVSNTINGIILYGSGNNSIRDNIATNSNFGIWLCKSPHNTLADNTASSNSFDGIALRNSWNNTLTNNTASSNGECGISLQGCSNNILNSNTALNDKSGITLFFLRIIL